MDPSVARWKVIIFSGHPTMGHSGVWIRYSFSDGRSGSLKTWHSILPLRFE